MERIPIAVSLGAAANTGGLIVPIAVPGSSYARVVQATVTDRVGMSGASGSVYTKVDLIDLGTDGTGTTVIATRSNNAAAADYIAAYVPWNLTVTAANANIAPGHAIGIKVGGSGANGTFTDGRVVLQIERGYADV